MEKLISMTKLSLIHILRSLLAFVIVYVVSAIITVLLALVYDFLLAWIIKWIFKISGSAFAAIPNMILFSVVSFIVALIAPFLASWMIPILGDLEEGIFDSPTQKFYPKCISCIIMLIILFILKAGSAAAIYGIYFDTFVNLVKANDWYLFLTYLPLSLMCSEIVYLLLFSALWIADRCPECNHMFCVRTQSKPTGESYTEYKYKDKVKNEVLNEIEIAGEKLKVTGDVAHRTETIITNEKVIVTSTCLNCGHKSEYKSTREKSRKENHYKNLL